MSLACRSAPSILVDVGAGWVPVTLVSAPMKLFWCQLMSALISGSEPVRRPAVVPAPDATANCCAHPAVDVIVQS